MFSASLEIVLTIAYREAVSRRHAYLTLEHLLYALAHDPDGERILERLRRGSAAPASGPERVPRRRRSSSCGAARSASRSRRRRSGGCCRRRCCTCRARSGRKSTPATSSPPCCSSRSRRPRGCSTDRASRGSTSSTTSRTASPRSPTRGRQPAGARRARAAAGDEGLGHVARSARGLLPEPHRARPQRPARSAHRPHRRTAAHDRGALPSPQEQSRLRRRRRRRQDGAWPRDSPRDCWQTTCRIRCKGAEVFSLDTGALLAGTRFRGDFEERFKAVITALAGAAARHSLHRRDALDRRRRRDHRRHDGSRDADQADPHGGRPSRHRLDDLRGVQAHREGPRARPAPAEDRHRRAVDRGDRADSRRPARPLRGASRRHLHRRGARGRGEARRAASARLPAARQRHRPDRRGRRGRAARDRPSEPSGPRTSGPGTGTEPWTEEPRNPGPTVSTPPTSRPSSPAWPGSRPARRHRPIASACARSRSRSSAWSSASTRPCISWRRPSSDRAPASACPIVRPAASCSRDRPASARPSSPSSSRCSSATSSSAST